MLTEYTDGVFFVELAAITNPEFVVSTIAQPLGIKEAGGKPILEVLKDYLRERHLLLAIDNFEQVIEAAPQIAKRLASGEVYDILISPPAVIDGAIKDGKVIAEGRVRVGRVGGGVHVRSSAQAPAIATAEALKQAVLAADSVVYNTASTGLYLDKLFAGMGILEQLAFGDHVTGLRGILDGYDPEPVRS